MIEESAWVSIGAILGANLRFGLIRILHLSSMHWHLPLGVLVCNSIGSFLAGALWAYSRDQEISVIASRGIMIGFLGSLTTFSAFAVDSMALGRSSAFLSVFNIGFNLAGSLGGAYLGSFVCRRFFLS